VPKPYEYYGTLTDRGRTIWRCFRTSPPQNCEIGCLLLFPHESCPVPVLQGRRDVLETSINWVSQTALHDYVRFGFRIPSLLWDSYLFSGNTRDGPMISARACLAPFWVNWTMSWRMLIASLCFLGHRRLQQIFWNYSPEERCWGNDAIGGIASSSSGLWAYQKDIFHL